MENLRKRHVNITLVTYEKKLERHVAKVIK